MIMYLPVLMLTDTSSRIVVIPDIVICAPVAFVTLTLQSVSLSTAVPVILTLAPVNVAVTGPDYSTDVISPICTSSIVKV